MSFFDNPDQLHQLQNLLYPKGYGNGSDTDDDDESVVRHNLTPADIGPTSGVKKNSKSTATTTAASKVTPPSVRPRPETIEEWDAMQEQEDRDILDTRKRPEYKITYRQAVGTEDVFFQINNRTNATASCEDLIIEISLPDETMTADKMDLTIKETEIDLATSVYRLKLPLVQKINVDRCNAKYDAELRTLRLTLRMKREFDFVNF